MCFTSISVMVKACCFVPYTFHWRRVADLSGEKLKKIKSLRASVDGCQEGGIATYDM